MPFPRVRCLNNINFLFLIAFILGLVLGDYASHFKELILPSLVLIMSLSATGITFSELKQIRRYLWDILIVVTVNYLFLSGLILLANDLLVKDHDLYVGFVVMAAIPSAVAVVPFTYLLKGEMMVSLTGSISLYLLALFVAPFLASQFLEIGKIEPFRLFSALVQMILIPFLLSRLLLKWRFFRKAKDHTPILMNLAFSLLIYVVIGMNRHTFLGHFDVLLLVSFVAFLRTFVSGHLVDLFFRLVKTDRERRMSYVLFGSFKNLAVVAAIAIVLFNDRAAIPAAVAIPFEILFFVWFNYFQERWG
ncbi:MAG: bile acid:sodium symporter family protein [Thermodesulfobacteriota bacterium]